MIFIRLYHEIDFHGDKETRGILLPVDRITAVRVGPDHETYVECASKTYSVEESFEDVAAMLTVKED